MTFSSSIDFSSIKAMRFVATIMASRVVYTSLPYAALLYSALPYAALLCTTILVLSSSHVQAADSVTKKSDPKPITGELIKAGKEELVVKTRQGKSISIPVNDLKSISWDGDPKSVDRGLYKESQNAWDDAIAEYKKALAAIPSKKKLLRAEVEFYLNRSEVARAMTDPAKQKQAIDRLNVYLTRNANFYRYYDAVSLLGKLYLAKNDFKLAKSTFEKLQSSSFPDLKMESQSALANIAFVQKDYAESLKRYQTVIGMPTSNAATKVQHWNAMLGKAKCLGQTQKFDAMLKTLQEIEDNLPKEESGLLSEMYLRKGDCLVRLNKKKEALLAYLVVDIIFPNEDAHAESLYKLVQIWNQTSQAIRSQEAETTLRSRYPQSPWTKRLDQGSR